jgi:hypothetical protein
LWAPTLDHPPVDPAKPVLVRDGGWLDGELRERLLWVDDPHRRQYNSDEDRGGTLREGVVR